MESNKGKVILFLGGARSGKSDLAERIASDYDGVAYIATAEAIDAEMVARIENHKKSRPGHWVTYEVENSLHETFSLACEDTQAVIIDCMTVYIGRRMQKIADDRQIIDEIMDVVRDANQSGKTVLIVSNEVGMGVVPEYPVGRRYRDLLGIINQRVAEAADKVIFTIAGIPVDLKKIGIGEL